jgi:hypothetical protein
MQHSYSSTVSNCTIEKGNATIATGSVTINADLQHSFINAIKCLKTALCEAKFDAAGSLTAHPDPDDDTDYDPDDPNGPRVATPTYHIYYKSCHCDCLKMKCRGNVATIDLFRIMEFIFLLSILPADPAGDIWYDVQTYDPKYTDIE